MPVLRDRVERPWWGQPAGPGQRGRRGERRQHDDPHRHPLVVLRMGERGPPHRARGTARQRNSAQQVRQTQSQRQPQQRLQFVQIAQWGAVGIEERLHLGRDRGAEPAGVPSRQQRDTDQQHRDQPTASRHRAQRQTGQPCRGYQRRRQHRDRSRHQRGPRGGARRDIGRPRPGAAQHLGQRHPLRGDPGRFDEVEKRWADAAEVQQCHHPPRHRQHRATQPPRGEPPPRPVRAVRQQPHHRAQARRQRGDRVDRTHQRDRQC